MIRPRAGDAGFTLIEIALVLMIVGLMVGGGIYGIESYRERARIITTETNLRRVDAAITTFVAYRGRLPRPAANEAGAEGALDGSDDITEGLLPWDDLGLTMTEARDGWDQPLRYVVFDDAADDDEPLRCAGSFNRADGLFLLDRDDNPSTENASYVVYSLGEDGADQSRDTEGTYYYEAHGAYYDDIAAGRSSDQVLIDSGCRLQAADYDPCADGGCGTPQGTDDETPFVPGQVDFSSKRLHNHFNSSYEGYAGTTDWGARTVAPSVDTSGDVPEIAFDSLHEPNGNQDVRSCFWSHNDMPLEGSTVRVYFEASFDTDTTESRDGGLVFALLPWELPVRNGYNSLERCGYEGPEFLGYSPHNHNNSRDLYKTNEFTGNPDFEQVMTLGVELDVSRQFGKFNNKDFYDPPSSGSEHNHLALLVDNGFHNPTADTDVYPNDSCVNGDEGCYEPGAGSATERHWLERGGNSWHKVRLEIEDGAAACGADEVEIRAWIWPGGKECGQPNLCIDLGSDYPADATAHFVRKCQPKPTRTVDMGLGWVASSWDRMRPGFTTGMPNDVGDRNMPTFRNLIAAGVPKWSATPESAAGAVSEEIHNDLFNPAGDLNWTILNAAGGRSGNGWTGASRIAASDLGVTIMGYRGEIVVTPTTGRWDYGFGVKGVGGPTNEWDVPPLDNTVDEDERGAEGEEEALSFHFDARYDRLRLQLGQLSTGERARLVLYRATEYTASRKEYEITGCSSSHGGLLDLSPATSFDSVYIEPLPLNQDRSGTGSSFYVRTLRLCDAAASDGDCALDIKNWQSPCTLGSTAR